MGDFLSGPKPKQQAVAGPSQAEKDALARKTKNDAFMAEEEEQRKRGRRGRQSLISENNTGSGYEKGLLS
tara:strand:- start:391 stop:600 length:210 start_codon:yes stop_codon:yes gene_type:complete